MSCMTNSGYESGEEIRTTAIRQAALLRQAAAVLIAVDNAQTVIDGYRKQNNIAKRALRIAERQQWRLESVFWPRELQFLDEFANHGPDPVTHNLDKHYAGMLQASVQAKFGPEFRKVRCNKGRYERSQFLRNNADLTMAMASAFNNARHMGFDVARQEEFAREDRQYGRRFQAVALGRGLMQRAAGLMSAGSEAMNRATTAYAGRMNEALNNLGSAYQKTAGQWDDNAVWKQAYEKSYNPASSQSSLNGYLQQGAQPTTSITDINMSLQGNTMGGSLPGAYSGLTAHGPSNANYMDQVQQINNGYIGNRDRVRTGIVEFPVVGGSGAVFVDMDQFQFIFADDEQVGL